MGEKIEKRQDEEWSGDERERCSNNHELMLMLKDLIFFR